MVAHPKPETLALIGGDGQSGGAEVFNDRLRAHLRSAGMQVRSQPLNSYLRRGRPALLVWRWLATVCVAILRVWIGRPDHVLVSCANFLDVLAARAMIVVTGRRDIAIIAHFNSSWSFWQKPTFVEIFRKTSAQSRLFAISPSQRRFFIEQGLTVEPEIFPNFFNYAPIASNAGQAGKAQGSALKVLYVGRIVPEKRVAEAAEYLARLASDEFSIALRLAGPYAQKIHDSIRADLPAGLSVAFLGPLAPSDVSQEMSQAEVFISFSGSDTLPLTYLEAAAHGLGVLTLENDVTRDVQSMTGNLAFATPDGEIGQERAILQGLANKKGAFDISALIARNNRLVVDLVRAASRQEQDATVQV